MATFRDFGVSCSRTPALTTVAPIVSKVSRDTASSLFLIAWYRGLDTWA